MADYEISAEIKADSSGFDKGIKSAQSTTKKFTESLKNITSSTKGLNNLLGKGLKIGAIVTATKKLVKAIDETSEAFKAEALSLKALETANKNNPLTNGESIEGLKEFASEIQRTTNYGDDYLFPFMTELIASGRTQAETMKIIKAATDIASSGSMSFESAIQQLNATMNGNIGRLGQQNAELKNLTVEQLKNGEAVDILAKKYAGLAESTVDTKKQLANLKGDLKEAIGQFTLPATDTWNKFWIGFYEKGIEAINKTKEKLDELSKEQEYYERKSQGVQTRQDIIDHYEEERQKLVDIRETYNDMLRNASSYSATEIANAKSAIQSYTVQIAKLDDKYRVTLNTIEAEKKQAEETKKQNELKEQQAEKDKKALELIEQYQKKVAQQKAEWEAIATVKGESVSLDEQVTFYENSLVELLSTSGGLITENNGFYKEQLALVQKIKEEMVLQAEEAEKLAKAFGNRDEDEGGSSLIDEKSLGMGALASALSAPTWKEKIGKILEQVKEGFKKAKEYAQKYIGPVVDVVTFAVKNGIKAVSGIIKGGVKIFGNLINLDLDDTTDKLLEFEDKILTFFVDTLPRLPNFINQALGSVGSLISQILGSVDAGQIKTILQDILSIISSQLPSIIQGLGDFLTPVFEVLGEMIKNILSSGMLTSIADTLLKAVTDIFNYLFEQLLGDKGIQEGIAQILIKAFEALPKVVKSCLKGLLNLIKVLLKSLLAWVKGDGLTNLVDTVLTMIDETLKFITENAKELADILVTALEKTIDVLLRIFPEILPDLVSAFVELSGAVVEAVLKALPRIFVESIKALPNIFTSIGESIWDAVVGGVNAVGKGIKSVGEGIWNGIKGVGEWISDGLGSIFGFATGVNNAPKGLALVGEQGPELVDFHGGERVYTAQNTKSIMQGASGGNTFNVTFQNVNDTSVYQLMKQLKTYNRQMAINGVL